MTTSCQYFSLRLVMGTIMALAVPQLAHAQAAWDTPAATTAPSAETATVPAAPVQWGPGWLVTARPRAGESLTEQPTGTLFRYVSAVPSVLSSAQVARMGLNKTFLAAVYEFDGVLNITNAARYTFTLQAETPPDLRESPQDMQCGLSLNIAGQTLIPMQVANLVRDKKAGDGKSDFAKLTTEALELAPGTYPVRWTSACRPAARSVAPERNAFQDIKTPDDRKLMRNSAQTSLLVQIDDGYPEPVPASMVLHDKAGEPGRDGKPTAPSLQPGVRSGWEIATYARDLAREADLTLPLKPPVLGTGRLGGAILNSTALAAVAGGKDPMPDFSARSTFLARESGEYTFGLIFSGLANFNSTLACRMTLSVAGQSNVVNDFVTIGNERESSIAAGGITLPPGAHAVEVTLRCKPWANSSKTPVFSLRPLVRRPGLESLSPVLDNELVFKE